MSTERPIVEFEYVADEKALKVGQWAWGVRSNKRCLVVRCPTCGAAMHIDLSLYAVASDGLIATAGGRGFSCVNRKDGCEVSGRFLLQGYRAPRVGGACVRVRTERRPYGTCRAEGCDSAVTMGRLRKGEDPDGGRILARAFCRDHARERDLELSVRNASGRTAEVVDFADWERGPDGSARRRADVD